MAYAGNIIIQTKLDNKEFNKNLESLNKKLKEIKFENLTKMRSELNLCQTALRKMVESMKEFNALRLNSKKFDYIATKTHEASNHLMTLDRHMLTLVNRLNSLNIEAVSKLKNELKTISGLEFENVDALTTEENTNVKTVSPEKMLEIVTQAQENIGYGSAFSSQQFTAWVAAAAKATQSIRKMFTSMGKSVIKTVKDFTKKSLSNINKWQSNLKKTLKRTSDSFKSFMYALGVDVSFAGIVRTIKNTVQEMQDMQSTILGFNTMIDVQGLSLDRANDFVKKYASDGLVSLQGAMTQYKNFTLRGFKAEEIERLMTIAKDFAIVNKKAGVDLETALINLSEGIKLDLSRLMDASGLSENLSNIYSDYANEIGKGVSSLTDEERNKAILKYFEGMNRYSEGNAAKIAKTFIGTVSRLKTQTKYMFAELGNTIAFIAKPFLEDLIKAFTKLEQIFKNVNDFIRNSVFGVNNKMKELADEYNAIQNSVENITDLTEEQKTQAEALKMQYESIRVALKGIEKSLKSVVDSIFVITRNANGEITKLFGVTKQEVNEYKGLEKNSKTQLDNLVNLSEEKADFKQVVDDSTKSLEEEANAAEKILAPFDTINQMKFKTGGEDESQELINEDMSETAKEETTETIFWIDFLKTAIDKFLKGVDFEPLNKAWNNLKKTLFGDGNQDITKGIDSFYNILKNIVTFTIEKAIPTLLNVANAIAESFKNANIDLEPLKDSLKGLFDTIFGENGENLESTVGFLFNEIIIPVLKWIIEWALPKIITLLDRVFKFVQEYGPYFVKVIKIIWAVLEPILNIIFNLVIGIFDMLNNAPDWVQKGIVIITTALALLGVVLGGLILIAVKLLLKIAELTVFFNSPVGSALLNSLKGIGTWVTGTAIPWITGTALPGLWGAIKAGLAKIGAGISTALSTFLGTVASVILSFIGGFKLGQYIAEHWLTEEDLKAFYWNVMTAVDAVKTWFYNVVEDIKDFFKSIPDAVKGFFNNLKNWFNNLDLFGGIFKDADSLGDVLGNAWDKLTGKNKTGSTSNPLDGYYGYTSPYTRAATTSYTVPAYANGVVLPANSPRLAIVGDQKQGTSIETQISTMMEAMQRVLSQNQNGQVIQNVLKVDGQVLYKSNNKVSRQRGAKMISR